MGIAADRLLGNHLAVERDAASLRAILRGRDALVKAVARILDGACPRRRRTLATKAVFGSVTMLYTCPDPVTSKVRLPPCLAVWLAGSLACLRESAAALSASVVDRIPGVTQMVSPSNA
jgi:hypothetical protein